MDEAARLNRVVTNLLQATRLDAGPVQLRRSWLSLDEIVTPALERLQGVLALHPVRLELPEDLPPVLADPVLLELLFQNLLENVARHTPPGTPATLSARLEPPHLVVELEDEGPGLPPGGAELLFARFQRGPGSQGGTGLGLSIARGIAEAHAGTLTAHPRPGGGTLLRLVLPVLPPPPSPREAP